MSLKNWRIKCNLISPLCGDAPRIDAIMEYELSLKMGMKHARKLTRNTPLSEIERPPIPVCRRTINGFDMYCASDPIIGNVRAEYTERQSKRFDSDMIAPMLDPKNLKNLNTSSGPYKSRYVPLRVRNIDCITWIVRGDRQRIAHLLKGIYGLGSERSYGYGAVHSWEYEEIEEDLSIFARDEEGKKILMKTVPAECANGCHGFRRSYGGAFPPYWHPDTFMEVAIPC